MSKNIYTVGEFYWLTQHNNLPEEKKPFYCELVSVVTRRDRLFFQFITYSRLTYTDIGSLSFKGLESVNRYVGEEITTGEPEPIKGLGNIYRSKD